MAQDFVSSKNLMIDKDQVFWKAIRAINGYPITTMETKDPKFKEMRKHLGIAFYKNNLGNMLDSLKEVIHEFVNKWLAEIETSSDKTTVIDMAVEFQAIFSKNIIAIACGSTEANEELVDFMFKIGNEDNYETKKVTIAYGLRDCF